MDTADSHHEADIESDTLTKAECVYLCSSQLAEVMVNLAVWYRRDLTQYNINTYKAHTEDFYSAIAFARRTAGFILKILYAFMPIILQLSILMY